MIQRASRYYFGNSPNERAIFDLDFAGLGLAGHRIEVYGGSLAEEVYVGHGFTIDLTNLAGGRDLIYLKGASSDYTYANSGTVVTLTHTHIPGTVITFSAASLNQDLVLFTDGFVAASDFASAGIKPPGTPIPPVDSSRKSSSNPADLPAPTVGGSLRAESLDNNGANFSPVSPGTQLRVLGKDGVEQVYVGPGTIVDADELGKAQDLIYLTGNRTDYTFTASGEVLTLVRNTRFQGFEEKVFVTGGDKLIFRDGSVGTTDVINHLNTPGSSFPPLNPNEKTPLVTITEALNAIRGAAEANTADSAPIDAATYLAAGVTGIGGTDQPPVSAINSALNSGVMGALPAADGISGQEADETADVQAIVNAYTRILNKANDTADSPGNNQNDSSITVLVDDYVKIGASIGDATLSTPAGGNRLALLNDIVGGKRRVDVDTIGEINTLAGIANAIQTIAAGGSVSSKVTVANFGAIGLDTTGLVDGQNMDKLLADIATKNDNGSDTNSLAKLQAMINALDKTAPTISSVALSSATDALNGILNAGDVVSATVTFSEAVNVTGTPILQLAIGSSLVDATYSSGSGSTALVFRYTIKATDNDLTGIAIPANALSLGDGSIRDAGLNNAVLTSAAVADNPIYRVDTTAPTAIDLEAGTDGIQASQGQFYGRANAGSGKTLFPNLASFNGNSNSDIAQIEVSVGGTGLDTVNDKLVASAVTINLNTTGSGNNVTIGGVSGVSWSFSAARVLTLSKSLGGVFTEAQVIAIDKALQLRTTLTATQGDRTFTITHIDSAGNRAEPAVGTMTVDTIAPTQTVGSVSFSDDTGSSATDRITSTAVQTISGTLSAALGTNDLLFASVNGGITWTNITDKVSGTSITWDNATLSSGSLRFKVEDRAGNTPSTSSFSYTLDTVAPNPPSLTLGAGVSDGATSAEATAGTGVVTVNAEIGASVAVTFTRGNGSVVRNIPGTGQPSAVTLTTDHLSTLGDGAITVSAVATDAAGNVSTAGTTSFVLDTVAPNLVVTQTDSTIAVDGVINNAERDAGVVLSGTTEAGRPVTIATGRGINVSVTANNSGAWSATVPADNLPIGGSGIVTFTVTSSDAAGNPATVTRTAKVDTVAPNPPSLTLGAGVSGGATSAEATAGTGVVTVNAESGSSVVVTFINGNATVTKTITGSGSAAAATLANADLTTLGDGTINVSAVATDAAGNVSTAGTTSFVLDTVAPNLVVTQTNTTIAGDGVINNAERDAGVVLSGTTEAGRPVTITTGTSVSVTANNSGVWSATVPAANLPIGGSGIVTFTVTSTDAAGNLSTVTRTANVDTVAPTAYGLAITNLIDDTGSSRNVASGGAGNDSTPTVQGTLGTSAQGANLAADERLVVYRGMDMTGATSLTPINVSNGQIPNGYRKVTFTTLDGNWAQNIFLPTAPEIGDVVQMSRVSQIHTNLYQGNRLIKAFLKPFQAVYQWGNETDQYVWNGTDWVSALSQVGVATITPVVGGQSTWSVTDQGAWADNQTRSYIARLEDTAGNVLGGTLGYVYRYDITAPNPPTLALGAGVSDGATSAEARAGTGVVTVNAENGSSVVVIFTKGNATVTKTIIGTGSAAAATLTDADLTTLGNGTINVSAVATDAAGNVSTAGTTSFVLDTVAPNLVVTQTNSTIAVDGVINNAERKEGVLLSGTTEAGRSVTIATGRGTDVSVTANNSGAWSATVPADNLPIGGSGIVTFTVTSTDAAGNPATVTRTAKVDTVAPTAYGLAITNLIDDTGSSRNVASGGAGNDSTPTVQGTLGTSAQGANLAADERLVVYRGMDMTGATSLTPINVSNGQIPNGYRKVTFTTLDGNWAQNIFLPTAPEIGDVVQMTRISQSPTNLYQGNRLIKAFSVPYQAVYQWGNETDQYVWNGTDWVSALSQVGVATIAPVVGGQSTWSVTDQGAWADNQTRSYIARLEDTAGNVLGGTLGYVYRYDITAPNLVVTQTNTTIAGDGVINNPERNAGVALSGITEAGRPVTIATGRGNNLTVTADGSGAWSAIIPAANLPTSGNATFTITSSDAAGNTATVTRMAGVSTEGPELIVNGGFDNWSAWGASNAHWVGAKQGYSAAVLLGAISDEPAFNSQYYQTVPTVAGSSYVVSFDIGYSNGNAIHDDGAVPTMVFAYARDRNLGPVADSALSPLGLVASTKSAAYTRYSYEFVATGSSTLIGFAAAPQAYSKDVFLDNVSVKLGFANPVVQPAGTELIVNGGFDEWSGWFSQNAYHDGAKQGYSSAVILGANSSEPNYNSQYGQTINTVIGATYTVSFKIGYSTGNAQHGNAAGTAAISVLSTASDVNNTVLQTLTASTSTAAYSTHSYEFVATSRVTQIGFASGPQPNGTDVYLDDVSVKRKAVAPVVIDLNHDQQLDYGHVLMDVNGDGELDHTRWAGAADGVLVWDKYQDGQVHDHTQYAFAQYGGKTDLEGLAAKFDTHRDGVFDALDELFAQFKVWRDANQNGVSDAGEVRSLSDWGLSAIDLVSDGIERQPVPGVHEAGRTFATGVNGRAVLVADAAFEYVRASELDDYRVMA